MTNTPGVWGIDLGQCALKAIRLEDGAEGQVVATAFDYIEHPKILSQPDADPDQLTREALDKFLSRNNLRGDTVIISVPGQSGLARFVKLPPVEEKKINDIVRFEAKQQIPFPLEEVVWDYQKLNSGAVTDGFALETEIGLFAMKRDMVNRYLQHFKDVNVEVHMVQMAPLALCNYVAFDLLEKPAPPTEKTEGEEEKKEESDKKGCIVALDIGADNSNLVITDGERIIWQRPIPLGGNHFTRALTKDLKLTFAKAEHLKRNAIKSPDLKKILSSLKPVLNDFVGEVQRSLGYFTNTHRNAPIKYLLGLGNAFRLPGLQKFLAEKLQLEVRKLQKLERATGEAVLTAPPFAENVLSFAVPYGLAVQGLKRSKIQTNLLPQEIQLERLIRRKKPWAAAAAAVLLVGLAGLAFGYAREWAAYDPNINKPLKDGFDQVKRQVSEASNFSTNYNAQMSAADKSKQAVDQIAAGVKEQINWPLLLKYIADAVPQPDGSKIPQRTSQDVDAFKTYWNSSAVEAFQIWLKKQYPIRKGLEFAPATLSRLEEDKLHKNLLKVNIEAVFAGYSEDLRAGFFTKLIEQGWEEQAFLTVESKEKEVQGEAGKDQAPTKKTEYTYVVLDKASAEKNKEKLPAKGWVIEIRGFTDLARSPNRFLRDTLLENLVRPEAINIYLPPEMREKVRDRIKVAVLLPVKENVDPEPGVFKFINTTSLQNLGVVGGGSSGGLGSPGGGVPEKGLRPEGAGGVPPPKAPGGVTMPGGENRGAGSAGSPRDAWTPLGEFSEKSAGAAAGGGIGGLKDKDRPAIKLPPNMGAKPPASPDGIGGVNRPGTPSSGGTLRSPRYEFVILLVWEEATPSEKTDTTTP
jgi:type IV pilus assembly protein PilM